ncbi:unnamed protein product [Cylicostephanus goldi]|uniref:Uncharacterized protein n=1 Tax=Cylicostephanus goldi TaxID=71465 RepID=A0A3P7PZ92_CYLGO|nr:unnamed protein product [Cylicostephanus goldi]
MPVPLLDASIRAQLALHPGPGHPDGAHTEQQLLCRVCAAVTLDLSLIRHPIQPCPTRDDLSLWSTLKCLRTTQATPQI